MRERIVWITMNDCSPHVIRLWRDGDVSKMSDGVWIEDQDDLHIITLTSSNDMYWGIMNLLQSAGITDAEIQDHPVKVRLTFDLKREP